MEGSAIPPCPAATVPRKPMANTSGKTMAAARRAPFLRDSSLSEAYNLCQLPWENISAAVTATISARPDSHEPM